MTRGVFPLSFVRHYNSLADENTSMGAHWRSNYHRSIGKHKIGKGKKAYWVAEVHRHNGKTYRFNQTADGLWLGDPDVSDYLEETASGWRYITRHGVVEIYGESGRLSKIVNSNGHEHYLQYDGVGKLRQVQDEFGRSLVIEYSADDLVQTVKDPAGSVYRYAYDPAGNLSQVTYPDASTRSGWRVLSP